MVTPELPHVLVVGEDPDGTSSLCLSLASGRFRCTGAVGSIEAFAVSKKEGVDVALLDVSGLRPADGLKLAKRLRDEIEDLGVVMVADSRSLEDLVESANYGAVASDEQRAVGFKRGANGAVDTVAIGRPDARIA